MRRGSEDDEVEAGTLHAGVQVRGGIERHKLVWPIRVQCRVLRASVSGYHQHLARRAEFARRRHLSDEALVVHIAAVYAENRGAYGWPRVWQQLHAQGIRAGKRRVQRLMQKHGIHARGRRKFRVTTTDSEHNLPFALNLLDRNFTVAAPHQAWAGDFTYIATEEGWLFLAVVIDLFSRKVTGWSMRPDMHRNLVINAFKMAWHQRCPGQDAGLIFHSNRGSQYASEKFRKVLEHCSSTPSMSRKGNCWDNASLETLFGSLKVERCMAGNLKPLRRKCLDDSGFRLWSCYSSIIAKPHGPRVKTAFVTVALPSMRLCPAP